MKKLAILSLSAVAAGAFFAGCNSSYDNTIQEDLATDVIVSSFSLSKDDSILANLDTVFFSIDLQRGRIFNADSLPYGTKINKLVPVITFHQGASAVNLTVKKADGTDTVYNYVTNSKDSIDFSHGPMSMAVTSLYNSFTYNYTIEVNVHKLPADTLVWTKAEYSSLPGSSNVAGQKTVMTDGTVLCVTTDGSKYYLNKTVNPNTDWTSSVITMPAGADLRSFNADGDTYYILAGGALYRSADAARTWSSTGVRMNHIYGIYQGRVIGAANASGSWQLVQFPQAQAVALPEGMPVSGTSQPVMFTFPMGDSPQMVMVGGRTADGALTNATWAFDGNSWANISTTPVPKALSGMMLVPYYSFYEKKAFVYTRYSILLAMGGYDGKTNNSTVYLSDDCGMTWYEASETMQLPDFMVALHDADAVVVNQTFTDAALKPATAGRSLLSSWSPVELAYRIPGSAVIGNSMPGSRATEAITSWNCPYIYSFGGVKPDNTLQSTVWRATINRLMFKPIQ